MAKAPKPIMSKKGSPPPAAATVGNLNKAEPRESVALNFKVPRQFRRDFKTWAAQHDMSQQAPSGELPLSAGEGYSTSIKASIRAFVHSS
jgi:hypothetical protein